MSKKLVAIVDAEPIWQGIEEEVITDVANRLGVNVGVQKYASCGALLTELSTGTRFVLYLLAYKSVNGLECMKQIQAIQSDAKIIAISGWSEDPGFVEGGAKAFLSKGDPINDQMKSLFIQFLK